MKKELLTLVVLRSKRNGGGRRLLVSAKV